MCHRATVSGICPERCNASCLVRKRERAGLTENLPPPARYAARFWKLAGMLTGATPDCRPWPGRASPLLGWSVLAVKSNGRGVRQGHAATGLLTKKRQNRHQTIIFWGHVRSSKRFGRRFWRNRLFKKNLIYKKFVRNLMSKLARSTLTSPGTIRGNIGKLSFYRRKKNVYHSAFWQFFHVVAYNAEHFSVLLPTTQKNVPHCCLQCWSFFRVVGNNVEKAVISVHVCFSVLLPTMQFFVLCCWQQCGKIFEFNYIYKFQTLCKFTVGIQSGA